MHNEIKSRMEKVIDHTKNRFSTFRTGRATPDILNGVQVDYYSSMVPLQQLASVTVPESMMLMLNVFDQNAVKEVERALLSSDLNLNPQTEGNVIRLRLPELTEERRKELVKLIKKESEDGKIQLRNARREFSDQVKQQEKQKEISEDEAKKSQDLIDKITNDYTSKIDDLLKEKESEIMTI